jgi:CRP-like cAMP-binding protein
VGIEDDIALLAGVPLLAVLGDEALKILAFGAESKHVGSGTVLFREGDAAEAAFMVQGGSLRLATATRRSEAVIADRGALLCEAALLARTKHHVTATAETPARVLRISRNLFLRMLEGYPDAAGRLRRTLAQRLGQLEAELLGARPSFDQPLAKLARA